MEKTEGWKEIAEFVVSNGYDQIPEEARKQAKLVLLDTLGAMLAGSHVYPLPNLVAQWSSEHGIGPVTVVGWSEGMDLTTAALLNGTSAVALEMDEGNQFSKGHPASHIIPAALAWAELAGSSGKQLIESIVMGYEIATRIGGCTELRSEVHPHGTWGTIGAAVAVAKLKGFSAEEVLSTIRLAASLSLASTWPSALEGATVRNIYTGLSNQLGLLATDLTKAGITAARGAVESVYGQILSTRFDSDCLTQKLDEDYYISKNYFKMYSCCRYNHAALDAIQLILAEDLITDDQIDKIEVETYGAAAVLKEQQPANMLAAKFSVPFALAAYIVLGNAGEEAFSNKTVENERIRHLAQKITVSENPAFTAMLPQNRPARVTVYLKDGRTAERAVSSSQGGFDNPYPVSMILDKFEQLAQNVVGSQAAKHIINLCQGLEKMDDIQELTRWLI
ncbi:MmgE/PrpD family protein [Paradesulfitobacterium aromaticivorans]